MSNLARTYRTIRHLRPSQWYWRLRYRRESRRPVVAPRVPAALTVRGDFPENAATIPEILSEASLGQDARGALDNARDDWNEARKPLSDREFLDRLERGQFTHLNETRDLGTDPVDWRLGDQQSDRLWTITLHYHAWAWRLAQIVTRGGQSGQRADRLLRRYLGDWITRCDLTVDGSRSLAWNSYAIATRIGWWCRLYHLLGASGRAAWGSLETVFLDSLWSQAAWLSEHLEWDLLANHLLRNIVGLAWAGRFFEGSRPKQWLQTAARLAERQAGEQVLPDGGHFERSSMYHVVVMNDFLALAVLLNDTPAGEPLKQTWRRMAEFLAWARHPDGQVPLLNDSGFNGAPAPAAMLAGGKQLLGIDVDPSPRQGVRLFSDFGLAVWHDPRWSVFFDVGPVGPDYQPGHTHADTLAFEASYHGRRVFVDPGTLRYDHDASRVYDRSTASHNTVAVDNADSSEVWHIFRVGRRARPIDVAFDAGSDHLQTAASHTGYDHLPGRPRHRRELRVDRSGTLVLVDQLEGHGRHRVEGGLLLDPGWQCQTNPDGWTIRCGEHVLRLVVEGRDVSFSADPAKYHPEYGLELATHRLRWQGVVQFPYTQTIRIESEADASTS